MVLVALLRMPGGMLQQQVGSGFHRDVLARICVEPPYLRLERVEPYGPRAACAWVTFESPPGHEHGPLASAEIGRHLAILGSCALSRQRDSTGPHDYYLARAAVLERFSVLPEPGAPCFLTAEATSENTVKARLYAGRAVAATLTCDYQVLSSRLFARLFRHHRQPETPASNPDVYAHPLTLRCEWDERSASGHLGAVLPGMCAGHFREYPALPVARLMDAIHRLACEHLTRVHARPFRLLTCRVAAERLAFAGTDLVFSVRLLERTERGVVYTGSAKSSDGTSVYGQAELSYQFSEGGDAAPESARLPRLPR
jgi:hypothetical protein